MYTFNDLKMNKINHYIPSYALMVDGKTIEEYIPEFVTTSVYGRENIDIDFEINKINGMTGNKEKLRKINHRIITINYSIIAKDNKAFRKVFNKLNYFLFEHFNKKNMINFKDDEDYYYEVLLYEMSDVSANTNKVDGNFKLIALSPYKFSEIKEKYKVEGLEYPLYPIRLESIETTASKGNLFKLSNTTRGFNIILLDNFQGGEQIKITRSDIVINNHSSMDKLDYIKSDFIEFEIFSGDKLTVNSNEEIKIRYREVLL